MIEPARVLRITRRLLGAAVLGILVLFLVRFRFVSLSPECDTLEPAGRAARRVLVDRLPLLGLPLPGGRLERGDTVVYEADMGGRGVMLLGVVGALPGDEVRVRRATLWIAGAPTPYPPVPPEATGRVPAGRYLLFHTNPDSKLPDSRRLGWVDARAIRGRLGAVVPF